MQKQKQSENTRNMQQFKWFMTFTKKRASRIEDVNDDINNRITNRNDGVFYTLRKQFQKKLTSMKIKVCDPDAISGSTESGLVVNSQSSNPTCSTDQHDLNIAVERHNSIRFSTSNNTNLPVIFNRDVPSTALHTMRSLCVDVHDGNTKLDTMMENMRIELLKYGWYWGKLTRAAAQKRLARQDNGTFLVRDSQTERYQFTVSFRSSGITMHCRIDYKDNYWSFSGLTTPTQCETMIDLIEDTMKKSEYGIIGFVKQNTTLTPPFPVRLTKPINRFYEVSSLQHLCRFIIRQQIDTRDIMNLPLPPKLKDYIEENFYD
ncbi:uncharacterized protein LOC129767275 [Toxorhynchites rutilus septentrionalis]|uniref:uncharacterized protein LOC129767275 n=1 Tax=Toxorhynchites rutilus septentrionalis TaxID=329112 RepID=UPI00247B003F|nr:uncharacterized protein LOC129767275 [Toxorhynchites rutilus septentrionalis]